MKLESSWLPAKRQNLYAVQKSLKQCNLAITSTNFYFREIKLKSVNKLQKAEETGFYTRKL